MLTKKYDNFRKKIGKPIKPLIAPGRYIKSIVYGGLDGAITTFAVVASVSGAALSPRIILILGFANLIADGISMASGDYLSTKAVKDFEQAERKYERWMLEKNPKKEKKEVVDYYQKKGISRKDANIIASIFAKSKKNIVDVLLLEEGIIESKESAIKSAITTFGSFVLFGFIPLITYITSFFIPAVLESAFLFASILTGITFFSLGAAKVKITGQNWVSAGLEMLLVGGLAAAAAYGIGYGVSLFI